MFPFLSKPLFSSLGGDSERNVQIGIRFETNIRYKIYLIEF
jgi:hypothetical protein